MTASITTTTTTNPNSTESTSTHALTDEIASANANSSEGGLCGDTPYPYDSEDTSLATTSAASTPLSSTSLQGSSSITKYGANYGVPAATAPTTLAQSKKRPREEGSAATDVATTTAPTSAEEEWRKEWSKSNQRHYWFNVRTKQSVWHDPTVGK